LQQSIKTQSYVGRFAKHGEIYNFSKHKGHRLNFQKKKVINMYLPGNREICQIGPYRTVLTCHMLVELNNLGKPSFTEAKAA